MKVVLVHGAYHNSWESQALGSIGAYMKHKIPRVELVFFHGSYDKVEDIVEEGKNADFVAFSSTSPSWAWCKRVAKNLREAGSKARIIAGGYHTSSLGKFSLSEPFDQVVVGEGEDALVDIVCGNKSPVVMGRPMGFHELPWVDRALIRNERHIQVAQSDTGERITSFQSRRGCPWRCRFCADGFMKVLYGGYRPTVRTRAVRDLMDEIESVVEEYNLDFIKFCDPTWNSSRMWVEEFCREKILRNCTIPFFANIHARSVSEQMFSLMSEACCREIGLGCESGSPQILEKMEKGVTLENIREAVRLARQVGMRIRGYFLIGFPGEDDRTLMETEAFAESLDLDEYGFTIYCPYPGTFHYDQKSMADIDWEKTDEYSNDFWRTDALTNADLKQWQRRLASKFSRRLTWHQRMLEENSS